MAERIIQLANNLDKLSAKAKAQAFADGGWASEKLDGVWVAAECIGGLITFFSSSREEYISLQGTQLERDIQRLHVHSWVDFVLIGEAYIPGSPQAEISGVCRKEMAGSAERIELHCHDVILLEEWQAGISYAGYHARKHHLDVLLDGMTTDRLKLCPQYHIASAEELVDLARGIQGAGGEGVCYRPLHAKWESGNRGTNLIRIKEKITLDLEAIDVQRVQVGAKGGLEGVLRVRCRKFGRADGEEYAQDVRGMTHAQLLAWHESPSLIAGRIVEVEAMKYTAYGTLREPRFKSIREDKTQADL